MSIKNIIIMMTLVVLCTDTKASSSLVQLQGSAQPQTAGQSKKDQDKQALKKLDEEDHHLALKEMEDYPKYIHELMAVLDSKAKLAPVGMRKLIILFGESGLMQYRILKTPDNNSWFSFLGWHDYPPVKELWFYKPKQDDASLYDTRLYAFLKDHQNFDRDNMLIWNLKSGHLIIDAAKKQPNYMPIGFGGPACPEHITAASADGTFCADLRSNPDPHDVPELAKQHQVTLRVNSRFFAPIILARIAERTEKEQAEQVAPTKKKDKGWFSSLSSSCSGDDN